MSESSLRPAPPLVLCFGEALVDRLGRPGEDPAAPGAAGEDRLGGAPANVACALARLGTASAFLGRLGEDAIGAAFAALFHERGVDTRALQWDAERPSRTVLVRRDAQGERSFAAFAGDRGQGFADQAVAADPLERQLELLLAEARWLVAGTIPLASPASAQALERLLERSATADLPLALDVNWRPTFWGLPPEAPPPPLVRARLQPLLERASLIKCAAEEAAWLFGGGAEPAAIAAALPRRPAVLITDGPRPVRWWIGGRSGVQPPFAVPVVDTTGAGDAFTAGLLHRLVRRPEILQAAAAGEAEEVVRFASACGALVCREAGAIDPQPTAVEVELLLSQAVATVG